MGSAIIIPEMTDLNRGDQSLIWEAIRLLRETEAINSVALLQEPHVGNGANPQTVQSRPKADDVLEVLLKHPARGVQNKSEIQPALQRYIIMGTRAVHDWFRMWNLLQDIREQRWSKVWKGLTRSERNTIEAFSNAQLIVVKGGGAFHAYSPNFYWEYYLWYNCFHIFLAHSLNKSVVVLPNSFGPFPGRRNQRVIQNAFSDVALLTARESISAEVMEKTLGRKVPTESDLGFFIRPRNSARVDEVLQEWKGNNIATVTLRPWRFSGSKTPEKDYLKYIQSIAEVIEWLKSEGMRPIVVPHCLGPSAHEDDRLAIRDLSRFVGEENLEVVNTEGMDCEEIAALYGAATITIGTRFHSVIFSLAQGIPSVAIGYGGNKAKGIMTDIGQAQWFIPIEQVERKQLVRMAKGLLGSISEAKRTLQDLHEKVTSSRDKMKEDIKRILEK